MAFSLLVVAVAAACVALVVVAALIAGLLVALKRARKHKRAVYGYRIKTCRLEKDGDILACPPRYEVPSE